MRQTGVTFRAVLRALTLASEGKYVVYECSSHNMAKWTFVKALATSEPFVKQQEDRVLKLRIGEGSVRFSRRLLDRELDEVRSARGCVLIQDF